MVVLPFKGPFTAILGGPTGCGKSTFIFKLIKNRAVMIDPVVKQVVYSIPENQDIFFPDHIKEDNEVVIHRGIPNFEDFKDGEHRLLIIDDQAVDCGDEVVSMFTRGSHHFNISVIVLTQNIFLGNPKFRTLSLNAHYLIVYKSPRAKDQISCLGRQIFPNQVKFFMEAVSDAHREAHSYILLDMTQSCDEQLRLRSNVFPEDLGCTTVYVPK